MLRSFKFKEIVLGIALCFVFTQSAYSQIVVFQEDFDGPAGTDLGDSANNPWVTAFSRGDTGGMAAVPIVSVFGADGSIDKVADETALQNDQGALLALPDGALLADSVYTLSVTVDNSNNNWTAVGFASSDNILSGVNGRHSNGSATGFGGYAWGLTRNSAINDQEFFNGIGTGTANAVNGDIVNAAVPVTITIVLDTTDTAAITAEYSLNGTPIGPVETLDAGAFADIGFVGISTDGGSAADNPNPSTVSNFTLTVVTTPSFAVGDVDMNGVINILDISPFIAVLSSGMFQFEADIDGNGIVNILDITPFIDLLAQ